MTPLLEESVDKRERPSIRRQKKAATRGDRATSFARNQENPFTPSRPHLSRGRIEGLFRNRSTDSPQERVCRLRLSWTPDRPIASGA